MGEKVCKGCPALTQSVMCFFEEYDMEEECPCIECLVKVMCKFSCRKRYKIKQEISFSGIKLVFRPEYGNLRKDLELK